MSTELIALDELKQFSDRIFDVLGRAGITHVPAAFEPYWRVEPDDLYSMPDAPQPVIGDLGVDLSDLRWNLTNADEGFDIGQCAKNLAVFLNLMALSDEQGQFRNSQGRGGRR
jgi:hypothetical protein